MIDISGLKKAESALYESEEKYRSIIERMQDPFYRTDLQGHLMMVNPAFVKTFGYQGSDELMGRSITDTLYVNPSERDDLIRQLSRAGEVREFRLTLKRHDGTEGTYTASSHLIYDDAKQPIGVEGLFHDITDHLRVEEAFAEIESKYHELSELLPQMVFEMNPQCQITYANRYALQSMGYTHEDILDGLDIYDVIDPKDHARLKEMIENPSWNPPPGTHEYVGRKKDGITTPILVYLTAVFRNRSVSGYCGVIIDISERKKMELELIQKEELFREVFHNASDEIILHAISQESGPGPLILVNDITCEKLGYSREELLRLSLHDILPDASVKNMPSISKQLFSTKKVVFESAHRKKDGTIYPVEVNSHLFYLNGTPVTLSISRDITERKRAEEALRQANNKLNILSSITRHDLLNQLNALILFLELSKKQIHEDPLALTYLEKELEITQIMHHQIGFTKSYQDIGVKKPEWTCVETLLLQAAKHLGIQDSTLHISLSGLKIYADRLVVKVYYNLLENSLRHGGKISRISVSSHQTDAGMVIEYCDDGVGIPEENKELIFTKGFGSNTGWGMFLSREILSITNISIRETGTFGKGVRFEIEIPNGHWSLAP
jgi:PAS domain S-box-containing protein